MRSGTELASLKNHKDTSSNNGDEVEREVHEVPNNSAGRKLGERLGDKLAQFAYRVASRLDLTLGSNQGGLAAREKRAIKSINQGIIDEEVLAQDREDGRSFTQHKQDRCKDGKRAIEDGEKSGLWHIRDSKHQHRHTHAKRQGGHKLRGEGLP